MVRFTRDVEKMARRRGRNPRKTLVVEVVSVRERSPQACVDTQEKKS